MTEIIPNQNTVALGLDLGTSGVRVVAIDLQGIVVAQAARSYPLLTPHPGWTEQNPADWIAASLDALKEVAHKLQGHSIIALGLSGQMHGMVSLDNSGTVIRPAILWNDQRTGKAVAQIEATIPKNELVQRTGNPAVSGFQLPKVLWLRTEEPEAFTRTSHVLLPKDYLGYVLTGEMRTEPSDASGVGCLNLSNLAWDLDILKALEIDNNLFPQIIGSCEIVGRLKTDIATLTELPDGLPIIAGGGDNAASAIGLGISCAKLGRGSLSIGTSGVIFAPLNSPTPEPEGRAHLFCHVDGGYHLLGVTLAAGGSLRWYRDTFAPTATYDQLISLAENVPAGANGVIFLPHLAGERTPYLDPDARGAWIGLSLAHHAPELTRALLEGVAFSLRAALDVMTPLLSINELVATGGGAKSRVWLQILADVLGIKLKYPKLAEGAAYGAALLALVGAGAYPTIEDAIAILPNDGDYVYPTSRPIYTETFERYKALYTALKELH